MDDKKSIVVPFSDLTLGKRLDDLLAEYQTKPTRIVKISGVELAEFYVKGQGTPIQISSDQDAPVKEFDVLVFVAHP